MSIKKALLVTGGLVVGVASGVVGKKLYDKKKLDEAFEFSSFGAGLQSKYRIPNKEVGELNVPIKIGNDIVAELVGVNFVHGVKEYVIADELFTSEDDVGTLKEEEKTAVLVEVKLTRTVDEYDEFSEFNDTFSGLYGDIFLVDKHGNKYEPIISYDDEKLDEYVGHLPSLAHMELKENIPLNHIFIFYVENGAESEISHLEVVESIFVDEVTKFNLK